MKGKNYRAAQRGWLTSRRGMARAQVAVAVDAGLGLVHDQELARRGRHFGEFRSGFS